MKPAVPVDRDALASKAADVGPAASARRERGGEKEGVGSDGLTAKGLELESRWVGRTRDTYLFMCFLRKGSRPLIPMLAVPDRALPKKPEARESESSSQNQKHRPVSLAPASLGTRRFAAALELCGWSPSASRTAVTHPGVSLGFTSDVTHRAPSSSPGVPVVVPRRARPPSARPPSSSSLGVPVPRRARRPRPRSPPRLSIL